MNKLDLFYSVEPVTNSWSSMGSPPRWSAAASPLPTAVHCTHPRPEPAERWGGENEKKFDERGVHQILFSICYLVYTHFGHLNKRITTPPEIYAICF